MMIYFRNNSEREAARQTFHRLFRLPLTDYLDTLMIVLSGQRLCVDILKLDEYLHNEFGFYEEKGFSMSEIIEKHYGPEAVKFLEACL